MQTVARKKLEIFIESTYVKVLLKVLDKNKVETYACLPIDHFHNKHVTSIEDDIINVLEFSMCVAIIDADHQEKITADINKVLARSNGFLYAQDIEEMGVSSS